MSPTRSPSHFITTLAKDSGVLRIISNLNMTYGISNLDFIVIKNT